VGDIIPRVVGQELAIRLKQPVVVENRPGGSGLVGATAGAHSAPDGYNLLLSTSGTDATRAQARDPSASRKGIFDTEGCDESSFLR